MNENIIDPHSSLIDESIKHVKYPDRPDSQEVEKVASRLEKDVESGFRGGANFIEQRGYQIAEETIKMFEQVVEENNASLLKDTVYENWEVEDCKAVLDSINLKKYESSMPEEFKKLYSPAEGISAAERLVENNSGEWLMELNDDNYNKVVETIKWARRIISGVCMILKKIIDKDPSVDPIKNKYYKDWSEEDIKNFFDILMEGQEKLKNDQDDYDYDNE